MRTALAIFSISLVMMIIPSAYAESAASASGALTGTYVITKIRHSGNNDIIDFTSSYVFTGTLSGTCIGVERDVVHSNENRTFFGTCAFQGIVGGRSGSALLRYEGTGSLTVFRGTTNVRHGTGDLTGLVLEASWEGHATGPLSAVASYSGHVHL